MRNFIIFFIFALLLPTFTFAQEFSKLDPEDFDREKNYGQFNYFQLQYFNGTHVTGSDDLKDLLSNGYRGLEFRVGTQSTGKKEWQRLHKYPQYGLGTYIGRLGDQSADSILGTPSGVYFFFGAPWFRAWRITFVTDLAVGLSYDFNPYDVESNPYNNLIGSSTNLYFNMNFLFYVEMSERLDLALGFNFAHYSNGRTFTPQRGINLAALNVGLKYNFNPVKNYTKHVNPDYQPPIRPEFITAEKSPFKSHHELQVMFALGTVQEEPDTSGKEGDRYLTNSIAFDYAYQVARKMKLVAGVDIFYDGSLENTYSTIKPKDEVTTLNKMTFGGHAGFHYLIERFAFIYNIGWYLYKDSPARGNWYMRAGGRIGITENIDAHLCLKTRNGGIADWIEWGAAYKFKL